MRDVSSPKISLALWMAVSSVFLTGKIPSEAVTLSSSLAKRCRRLSRSWRSRTTVSWAFEVSSHASLACRSAQGVLAGRGVSWSLGDLHKLGIHDVSALEWGTYNSAMKCIHCTVPWQAVPCV